MSKSISIALCLSGGGFRATLFHLGVLKRLHELGLLERVKMVSAVSGGAVTAALFHHHVHRPVNLDNFIDQFEKDGCPLSYDWQPFQSQLLQATRSGILGPYLRSFGIWISSGLVLTASALYFFSANWANAWIFPLASILALLVAVILYLSLLPQALEYVRQRDSEIQEIKSLDEDAESFFVSRWPSIVRALALPLSPGKMRVTTLDTLFDHSTCGSLKKTLLLCLGAVELNCGRQMVFSNLVLAELGPKGSKDLWEQRYYEDEKLSGWPSSSTFNIKWLPVAEAVAASSAFPPFFRPIVIRRGTSSGRLVGVFSDGGVVDNAALLAPIDMMIYCSQNWQRYARHVDSIGARIGPLSFEEAISDIFVVNAGAPAAQVRGRWSWFTMRLLRRIVDIMQGAQEVNLMQKLWLMDRAKGPTNTAITIDGSAFPLEDGSLDSDIPYYIARIRTHFDAFDQVETATLVYSGYCQTNLAFGNKVEASKPLRSFRDIAREVTGAEMVGNMSKDEIVRHLRCSNHRLSGVRKIYRAVVR